MQKEKVLSFLLICWMTFFSPIANVVAKDVDVQSAEPGSNITIFTALNESGKVCVRMVSADGSPVDASFWINTYVLGNKDLGRFSGSACFEFSGIVYKLRAGELNQSTIFYVTADAEIWMTISLATLEELGKL